MSDNSPRKSDEKPWQKRDKKPGWYERLSTAEKWEFHAETYAWRQVWLGVPDYVRASPCDPNGEWFDEGLVHAAALQERQKYIQRFDHILDEPWANGLWPNGSVERREAIRKQEEHYRGAAEIRANRSYKGEQR